MIFERFQHRLFFLDIFNYGKLRFPICWRFCCSQKFSPQAEPESFLFLLWAFLWRLRLHNYSQLSPPYNASISYTEREGYLRCADKNGFFNYIPEDPQSQYEFCREACAQISVGFPVFYVQGRLTGNKKAHISEYGPQMLIVLFYCFRCRFCLPRRGCFLFCVKRKQARQS